MPFFNLSWVFLSGTWKNTLLQNKMTNLTKSINVKQLKNGTGRKLNIISNSIDILHIFRSSHRRCSAKKGVLRNFAKFTGKHFCQSLFFDKLYWKRGFGTGVFLWILWNFLENLFYRTPLRNCFCVFWLSDLCSAYVLCSWGLYSRSPR